MTTINEILLTGGGTQEEEINSLRNYFKDNIRILSSIGQYSYILKIRAEQYDVSLTLQLDRSYPSKIPDIILTAPRLTPDQISVVQQLLQSYGQTLLNQAMILPIYSRLLQWFDENNIQTLSINMNPSTPQPATPRSPSFAKFVSPFAVFNNQNRSTQNDSHESETLKQNSTKLIDHVLARLESDSRLDKSYIRVGYIDRCLGLQEKLYQDFDFKIDPSESNERSTVAVVIPKYSIQYFKYGNEIIWDRERKTDLIIGSSDNQQSLDDIINRHRHRLETMNSSLNSHCETLIETVPSVTIKRFLTVNDGLSKPNYFLSIPISNASLINHYITYREHLRSSYPSLFSSSSSSSNILSYDPAHLHLVLLTLRLNSSLQLEQCILALKRIQEEIHYHCSYPERISLEFQGLDTFFGKSLYIKCQAHPRLFNLRTLIIERLCEQQQKQKMNDLFFAGNYQEFIPHLILFKSKRKLTFIPQDEMQEIYFGQQMIDALQLSSFDTNENEQKTSHCVFKLDLS